MPSYYVLEEACLKLKQALLNPYAIERYVLLNKRAENRWEQFKAVKGGKYGKN